MRPLRPLPSESSGRRGPAADEDPREVENLGRVARLAPCTLEAQPAEARVLRGQARRSLRSIERSTSMNRILRRRSKWKVCVCVCDHAPLDPLAQAWLRRAQQSIGIARAYCRTQEC